jgi:phosphatidylglycerol:prolipoprotein diacylglycerol transferase
MHFFPSRQIALAIGPLSIHWYGIMYALGFIVGILLLPRLARITRLELSKKAADDIVLSIFLGVILGGRLGFLFFYGFEYFVTHPLEIFAVWQGGMSSHGGFLGVALALFLCTKKYRFDFFRLTDTIVVPVALGLMLGRLGNLINGELYGTVTTLPWGMHFPVAEGLRHPTQIYAMIKDAILASVSFFSLRYFYRSTQRPTGQTTAIFLMLYAVLRFTVEIFRDQPYGYTDLLGISLSRGQLLTIPLFLAGLVLFFLRRNLQHGLPGRHHT